MCPVAKLRRGCSTSCLPSSVVSNPWSAYVMSCDQDLSQLACGSSEARAKGDRAVVPGSLDEESAHVAVSGLGNRAQSPALPAGVLTGNETDEGHRLARRAEAMEGV